MIRCPPRSTRTHTFFPYTTLFRSPLKTRLFLRLLACLAITGAVPSGAAFARPEVTAARIGDTPERTRFVLEMSADLPYRVFTLPDPFRVVVDLPEVAWSLPDARQPQARGLIDRKSVV